MKTEIVRQGCTRQDYIIMMITKAKRGGISKCRHFVRANRYIVDVNPEEHTTQLTCLLLAALHYPPEELNNNNINNHLFY